MAKSTTRKRPPKTTGLKDKILTCLDTGAYKDTSHAIIRKHQRRVSLPDIIYVLKNGWHEKQKDEFHPEHDDWAYAIRGLTIDQKDLRIVIAFDDTDMLIITAIVITRGNR